MYKSEIFLDEVSPLEFYGVNDEKIELLKQAYPDVKIVARGNAIRTMGEPRKLEAINSIIRSILQEIRRFGAVDTDRVSELIQKSPEIEPDTKESAVSAGTDQMIIRGVNGTPIRAKTPGQQQLVQVVGRNDVVFAIGPAGSGKSFTAVALAVKALKEKTVRKIVLVRPAVEAGEHLGFLPGDFKDKIDPYLRPLYDALEDMVPPDRLREYIERNIIEIVPLAYMRGRTLNHAFIILDEAQNATERQLKMFLTRMGNDSRIIITGDTTQIDLPRNQPSGLVQCERILADISGIGFVHLSQQDVVRHPLVKKIITAYDRAEAAHRKHSHEINESEL